MLTTTKLYCPYCRSPKPLWKAGFRRTWRGDKIQQWVCRGCRRHTVNPRKSKPRVRK